MRKAIPGTDFEYGAPSSGGAGPALSLSIFADRPHLLATMREDAQAAGFDVRQACSLEVLLDDAGPPLGEVVLVDCPQVDDVALTALARLDMRANSRGSPLIVETSMDALDDVFGCIDLSTSQLLVDPSRAERMLALGRVLARGSQGRVRDLSEEDRLMVLRLTEQVGQIAQRLDRINSGPAGDDTAGAISRVEALKRSFAGEGEGKDEASARAVRTRRPPLPDPQLVRRIIRQRQLRARFFDADLFADPAWDMLLDLTAARAEHARVSVTSLCIASGVPPTTALRWIVQMTESGLFNRLEDETDRRRAFIVLSDEAADGMARYFNELGPGAATLN